MFIDNEDYRVVIGEAALKVVSQSTPENIANAEVEARSEERRVGKECML